MKNYSKTEHKIINAGKKLFWKYGISKVTIEEIALEAGISKMSVYRSFKNKFEIAKEVLSIEAHNGLLKYEEIMRLSIPFADKIQKLLEWKHQQSEEYSFEVVKDIYLNTENGLFALLESYKDEMLERIKADFRKAQQEGFIRQNLHIDFIIYFLNSLNQKLKDDALLALFDSSAELVNELNTLFFYGIIERKDER